MLRPGAEIAAVFVLAGAITVVIAAPVLRTPSERIFGMEIVGRHRDPFTVMAQFQQPGGSGVYSQPVTDVAGRLLTRLVGPVAGYNYLVLLSFPLSAAAAYLLARHLTLSPAGAMVAATAFAFSPFHLAQAAYHPHIAQTQWIPLYFLALWSCLDSGSPLAVGFLGTAGLLVTLSNFYGGLIAAVTTPAAIAAYWLVTHRAHGRSRRRLAVTIGSLVIIGASGIAVALYTARAMVVNPFALAFPRADLFRYSAKWWSYLIPPVEHPILGTIARRVWLAAGVREGLLEHQVSLGWGTVVLGLIAVAHWLRRDRRESLAFVPVLVLVAATALVCSLSPERRIGSFNFVRPSALLHMTLPMFRAYARFGVVVQLMASLLAGVGVDALRRMKATRARVVCLSLVLLAAAEYAVSPSAMSRDVLPTQAHRWLARSPDPVRALDCAPLTEESDSIRWLTGDRVALLGAWTGDCTEPNLPDKLAALGYTHLLLRENSDVGRWFAERPVMNGLRVAAHFDDSSLFAVTAARPAIYMTTTRGLSPRERDPEWAWQWMGRDAAWTVINSAHQSLTTGLAIELSAFHQSRQMTLLVDGCQEQTLSVEPSRRTYQIGPLSLAPGSHEIAFHAIEPPTVADEAIGNGDRRQLSFALGSWSWITSADTP